jgi:hypothetical protein
VAEIEPQSLEELDAAADAFAALVAAGLVEVIAQVLEEAAVDDIAALAPSDVDRITVLWGAFVTASLLPFLAASMADAGAEASRALTAVLGDLPFLDEPLDTQQYLAQAQNRLVGIGNELWFNARTAIADGLAAGEEIPKIAARVRDAAGVTEPRARVIARTESHGARNTVNAASVRRVGAAFGVPNAIQRRWQAANDERTRETHRDADGQTVALNEPFTVGRASLDFPGDPSGPPEEVINCVPAGTRVQAKNVVRAYRYEHSGHAVTITTDSGLIVTVSPNHPVLTEFGWIPAEQLKQGQHVIRRSVVGDLPRSKPDVQRNVSTAEEVFNALAMTGNTHRMRGSSVNFHGDVVTSDVDVVTADRPLSFGVDTACTQQFEHFGLACTDAPAFAGGPEFHLSVRSPLTSDGIVSFADLVCTLRGGHLSPFDGLGFGLRPLDDAEFSESTMHERTADVEVLRQRIGGLSRFVALDEIINVEVGAFSGHMYSFETCNGIYFADGITSHNCRCTTITLIDADMLNLSTSVASLTLNAAAYQIEEREMPWSIVEGDERCDAGEFAVVKDEDRELEGCHASREDAEAQIAALNAAEAEEGADTVPDAAALSGRNTVPWSGVLVVEGVPTGDGRQFATGSLTWPAVGETASLEIPLGWMYERAHGGMSTDKVALVGRIDTITRHGNELHGTGLIDLDSHWGREAARLMGTRDDPGFLAGVSIDADDPADPHGMNVEYVFPESCPLTENGTPDLDAAYAEGDDLDISCMMPEMEIYHSGRIRAATLVDIPAYVEARLYLDQAVPEGTAVDATEVAMPVVASSFTMEIPDLPPMSWFDEPVDEPEIGAITITDDGRMFGYLAPKHVAHRGVRDRRVEVPMKNVDYGVFMNRVTLADDGRGGFARVATGPITMDCGHASTSPRVTGAARREHYDNSCSVVATVRVGENSRGVWIAGAILPDVTADQVRRMMACQLSGDWGPHREKPGKRELAGALLVPVPGFPKRSNSYLSMKAGHLDHVTVPVRFGRMAKEQTRTFNTDAAAARLAASIGRDRASRVHTFAANLRQR